jgi:hypothetical protein
MNTLAAVAAVVAVLIGAGIAILKRQRRPWTRMVSSSAARIEEFATARLADRVAELERELVKEQEWRASMEEGLSRIFAALGKAAPEELTTTSPTPFLAIIKGDSGGAA